MDPFEPYDFGAAVAVICGRAQNTITPNERRDSRGFLTSATVYTTRGDYVEKTTGYHKNLRQQGGTVLITHARPWILDGQPGIGHDLFIWWPEEKGPFHPSGEIDPSGEMGEEDMPYTEDAELKHGRLVVAAHDIDIDIQSIDTHQAAHQFGETFRPTFSIYCPHDGLEALLERAARQRDKLHRRDLAICARIIGEQDPLGFVAAALLEGGTDPQQVRRDIKALRR